MASTSRKTDSQEREEAPRLAMAPDKCRCEQVMGSEEGEDVRCSRFTIFGVDGKRERYCIAHSDSPHARALRSKGERARQAATRVESDRRRTLSSKLLPRAWKKPRDFQRARARIYKALSAGELTVTQAKELRLLLADAERHARVGTHEWSREYLA
jgi:hypothetical protein